MSVMVKMSLTLTPACCRSTEEVEAPREGDWLRLDPIVGGVSDLPPLAKPHGSCHCGNVKVELLVDIGELQVKEDNCSSCVRVCLSPPLWPSYLSSPFFQSSCFPDREAHFPHRTPTLASTQPKTKSASTAGSTLSSTGMGGSSTVPPTAGHAVCLCSTTSTALTSAFSMTFQLRGRKRSWLCTGRTWPCSL